jgi:hypothetical protein
LPGTCRWDERAISTIRPGHVFSSSDLARYITGVTIPVDGGTWASSGWSRDKEGRWHLFEGFADAYST